MVEMQVLEMTLEMNAREMHTYGVLASIILYIPLHCRIQSFLQMKPEKRNQSKNYRELVENKWIYC